jgi:hypothetical protein
MFVADPSGIVVAAAPGSVGFLSDSAGWGLLVGIALPLVQAVLQRPGLNPNVKRVIAVALSVLGGVITCWLTGTLHQQGTLVQTIGAIVVASQATYNTLLYGMTKSLETSVNGGKSNRAAPSAVAGTTGRSGAL